MRVTMSRVSAGRPLLERFVELRRQPRYEVVDFSRGYPVGQCVEDGADGPSRELAGERTDDVDAEDLIVVLGGDELCEARGLLHGTRATAGRK